MMSEADKRRIENSDRRKQDAKHFLPLDNKALLKEGMGLAVVNDLNSGFEAIVGKFFSVFRAGRKTVSLEN